MGLTEVSGANIKIVPRINQLFYALLYNRKTRGANFFWKHFNSVLYRKRHPYSARAGRYIFDLDGRRVNVAVEVWDHRNIVDQNALDWADIYFKVNKWPSEHYPEKVFPLVNGNGMLNPAKLALLRDLRRAEKEYDLNYMSILWFTPNDGYEHNVLEHHVRTFESLSQVDCKKKLLAVLPKYWPKNASGDFSGYLKRLDRAGVPWQHSWNGMSSEDFFGSLAKSRLVFLRPGNRLCISWRMVDLLCMEACVVYDGKPFPNWPIPLKAGENFLDCDCRLASDYSLPPMARYGNMRIVIEDLLGAPETIAKIRINNSTYFDLHAAPQRVAEYVLCTVITHTTDSSPLMTP